MGAFGGGGAARLCSARWKRAINFFDTADVYSLGVSEEVTGRALRDFARRDAVIIATKVHGRMSDDAERRRAVAQAHPGLD